MAAYNTGLVQVKTGSAAVKGTGGNEDFVTYVSVGDLFRISTESTFYTVAGITNASNLTLSSRYANSDYQTSRPSEQVATMTVATKMYSGTLIETPVIQSNVRLNASIEVFTDDGAGTLTGDGTPAGSGTVDYDTGAWAITLGTDLTATAPCVASYLSGDTQSAVSYQIVTDYTPNYNFPEITINDVNFQNIYTKALRDIDSAIYDASLNTLKVDGNASPQTITTATITVSDIADINTLNVTTNASANTVRADSYIKIGTNKYILAGNKHFSASIVAEATALLATPYKGSLYMGDGDVWVFTSDTAATKAPTS